mmetsp:Transcript_20055/g.59077  ORF Transcript_20055/g.59077 Transcript_20055/m.59077 type:complete len:312 (-) Transcript_20055:68-1003(-)
MISRESDFESVLDEYVHESGVQIASPPGRRCARRAEDRDHRSPAPRCSAAHQHVVVAARLLVAPVPLLLAPLLLAPLAVLDRRQAQHRVALRGEGDARQLVVAGRQERAVEQGAEPLLLGRRRRRGAGHALGQGAERVARRRAGRLVRLALLLEVEVRVGEEADGSVGALGGEAGAGGGALLREGHPAALLRRRRRGGRLRARPQLAAAHRPAGHQVAKVGGRVLVQVGEAVAGVGGGVGACLTPARDPVEARFDARRGILCSRDEAHPGELNPRGRTALLVGRCGDGAAEVAVVVGEWVAARRRDDGCRW